MAETTHDLPVTQLYFHPDNPRGAITPAEAEEMALSILLFGLIHPLIAVSYNGGWRIVDGHVRLSGAKRLMDTGRWPQGQPQTLPAFIRDLDPAQQQGIMVATNVTRYSLNPVDEGAAYKRKLVEEGLTAEQIAARFGVSRSRVESRLRIVNLAAPVVELFRQGKLPLGAAAHLARIEDLKTQTDLAITLIDMGAIHLDAIEEACGRVIGGGKQPKVNKHGGVQVRPTGQKLAPAAVAEVSGNGTLPQDKAQTYEGGPVGLAELRLAVTQTCRACEARQKLPTRVAWGKAEKTWLGICKTCEIVQRVSTACETCPLALFVDKLFEVTEGA